MIVTTATPDLCRDVTEIDCGNMGKLSIPATQEMEFGLSAREIAERYVGMVEQGCPASMAAAWAQGKDPDEGAAE